MQWARCEFSFLGSTIISLYLDGRDVTNLIVTERREGTDNSIIFIPYITSTLAIKAVGGVDCASRSFKFACTENIPRSTYGPWHDVISDESWKSRSSSSRDDPVNPDGTSWEFERFNDDGWQNATKVK